jgi:hypothetical protein
MGQLGAIASAVPVVVLLENTGWRTTFLTAAAVELGGAFQQELRWNQAYPASPRG